MPYTVLKVSETLSKRKNNHGTKNQDRNFVRGISNETIFLRDKDVEVVSDEINRTLQFDI